MDTIFMNSENSKTSEYHVLVLKLTDKLDLRRDQKTVALSNLNIYYTWRNVKSSYNNNKFKMSAPTWSEEFDLPDGSYSISDIQDYFEYILKKHSESVDNPSIRMYINRRILFAFVPNKSFGSLLEISPTNHVFLKTFNSEFQEVKVWFTDQTSKLLELEDKTNITLIIK